MALIAWRFFAAKDLAPSREPDFRLYIFCLFVVQLIRFVFRRQKAALVGAFLADGFSLSVRQNRRGNFALRIFFTSVLLITNLSYFSFLSGFKSIFDFLGIGEWSQRFRDGARRRINERASAWNAADEMRVEKEKPTISAGETPIVANGKAKVRQRRNRFAARHENRRYFQTRREKPKEAEPKIEPKIEPKAEIVEEPIEEEIVRRFPSAKNHRSEQPMKSRPMRKPTIRCCRDFDEEIAQIPISPMKADGRAGKDFRRRSRRSRRRTCRSRETTPQNFDNYVLPTPNF